MARPKVPLISRQHALSVALDIVDTEGIDALSIRRLGERLHVNGASLYHHFAGKEEIVAGVAALAVARSHTPYERGEAWRSWILRYTRRLREVCLAHPGLVPIILRQPPLSLGTQHLDEVVVRLEEEHVPTGAIAPMLEALELYAISSALHENPGELVPPRPRGATPGDRAMSERILSGDEIFEMVCEKIIDTVLMTAIGRGPVRMVHG